MRSTEPSGRTRRAAIERCGSSKSASSPQTRAAVDRLLAMAQVLAATVTMDQILVAGHPVAGSMTW